MLQELNDVYVRPPPVKPLQFIRFFLALSTYSFHDIQGIKRRRKRGRNDTYSEGTGFSVFYRSIFWLLCCLFACFSGLLACLSFIDSLAGCLLACLLAWYGFVCPSQNLWLFNYCRLGYQSVFRYLVILSLNWQLAYRLCHLSKKGIHNLLKEFRRQNSSLFLDCASFMT